MIINYSTEQHLTLVTRFDNYSNMTKAYDFPLPGCTSIKETVDNDMEYDSNDDFDGTKGVEEVQETHEDIF